VDAERSLYSRYYVQSLLNLDEHALKDAWTKAVTSTKTDYGGNKDTRMEYLSWRIWFLKRQQMLIEKRREAAALDDDTNGNDSGDSDSEDEGADGGPAPGAAAAGSRAGKSEAGKSDAKGMPRTEHTASDTAGSIGSIAEQEPMSKTSSASSLLTSGLRKIKTKASDVPPTESRKDIHSMVQEFMLADEVAMGGDSSPVFQLHSSENKLDRLYVVMISLHGLVRGEEMELGKDADTGGQVKYVVELAKAMSLHPAVYRVDLLTRMIKDPKVHSDYGMEEECLAKGTGEFGGSFIVRLPCGPTDEYVPKERLWPYVREFADRGIVHVNSMLSKMTESGRRCELYCVHGHYADAGECAMLMACTLGVPQITTGHSLGRNKLEHLLASGGVSRSQIEATYNISRRIEAEERCLDLSSMVFTSTQQEVDEQWGLYNGYDSKLAKVLHFRRSKGRHMPFMKVSPPGLDFSNLKVTIPEDPVVNEFRTRRAELTELEREVPLSADGSFTDRFDKGPGLSILGAKVPSAGVSRRASAEGGGDGDGDVASPRTDDVVSSIKSPSNLMEAQIHREPEIIPNRPPIWQDIARFLRNPAKPAILAMSRPDAKKNITTLVKAFGEHSVLRELANLVLIMGNRDNIASMAAGSQKVLTQVLQLIDTYDLYGSVAYPKHHGQSDISDIYLYATDTRGVFVNIALQEPFGLTVIEAAAHGVPTVATCNGGPVDIMDTLHHGVVVDPTDGDAVAKELIKILTSPATWDSMSSNGIGNIMAYSWPAHCKRYMQSMDIEYTYFDQSQSNRFSNAMAAKTMSGTLRKAMSRLDVLGIADTDLPQSPHDNEGIAIMHKAFSTPPMDEYMLGTARSAGASSLGGIGCGVLSGGGTPKFGSLGNTLTHRSSGITQDDIAVVPSIADERDTLSKFGIDTPTNRGATTSQGQEDAMVDPGRDRFVVVCLDRNNEAEDVAAYVKDLQRALGAADALDSTRIGVASMLGFETTHGLLERYGVDTSEISAIICNSGADIWTFDGDEWHFIEEYESFIDFGWSRDQIHRTLRKIVSSKMDADGHKKRLPRLKELLYNVMEEPATGVHPRHFCLELDPETINILCSGLGPRVKSMGLPQLTSLSVGRLKNRLRSKGFRANYTLQLVPEGEEYLAVLHITPIRASRPLALRWYANKAGMNMGDFITTVFPACIRGTKTLDGSLIPWTTDARDLIAGMHCTQIVLDDKFCVSSEREDQLIGMDEIALHPFVPDRVKVADSAPGAVESTLEFITSSRKHIE